jgi:hypothetical protein
MQALAANTGHVYIEHQVGTGTPTELIQFRADASTGALTPVGTTDTGTGPTHDDAEVRKLLVKASGKAMYGVFQ